MHAQEELPFEGKGVSVLEYLLFKNNISQLEEHTL